MNSLLDMVGSVVITMLLALAGLSSVADIVPQSKEPTGRVTGRVSVAGDFRRPGPLRVFKNRDFCGPAVANETLLLGGEGGLRNAVVLLRALQRGPIAQPQRLVLDNKQCAFVPHVQVAPLGSELLLKNSDAILHTVHARLGKETLFNVGLPQWREVRKSLGRLGVVRIDCDVLHTWMSAAIIVASTPYYSITDERGDFTVDRLPAGAYDVEVWHERLGTKKTRISVIENSTIALEVVYGLTAN